MIKILFFMPIQRAEQKGILRVPLTLVKLEEVDSVGTRPPTPTAYTLTTKNASVSPTHPELASRHFFLRWAKQALGFNTGVNEEDKSRAGHEVAEEDLETIQEEYTTRGITRQTRRRLARMVREDQKDREKDGSYAEKRGTPGARLKAPSPESAASSGSENDTASDSEGSDGVSFNEMNRFNSGA